MPPSSPSTGTPASPTTRVSYRICQMSVCVCVCVGWGGGGGGGGGGKGGQTSQLKIHCSEILVLLA